MKHNDYAVTIYVTTCRYRHEEGGYFVYGRCIGEQWIECTLSEARAKFREMIEREQCDVVFKHVARYDASDPMDNCLIVIERNGSRIFGPIGGCVRTIDPCYS